MVNEKKQKRVDAAMSNGEALMMCLRRYAERFPMDAERQMKLEEVYRELVLHTGGAYSAFDMFAHLLLRAGVEIENEAAPYDDERY